MADRDAAYDRIAGKVKETAGKVTGDKETKTEGKLQNIEGKIAEKADDVRTRSSRRPTTSRAPSKAWPPASGGTSEVRASAALRRPRRGGGHAPSVSWVRTRPRPSTRCPAKPMSSAASTPRFAPAQAPSRPPRGPSR